MIEFNSHNQLILVEKDNLAKDLNKIKNRIRFYLRNIDLDLVKDFLGRYSVRNNELVDIIQYLELVRKRSV